MRSAVANENGTVVVHEHAMRTGQLTFERIALRTIALRAGAGDQPDRAFRTSIIRIAWFSVSAM